MEKFLALALLFLPSLIQAQNSNIPFQSADPPTQQDYDYFANQIAKANSLINNMICPAGQVWSGPPTGIGGICAYVSTGTVTTITGNINASQVSAGTFNSGLYTFNQVVVSTFNNILYANQFPGADICAQIANAINASNVLVSQTNDWIVDARGFGGGNTSCSAPPIPPTLNLMTTASHLTLLMGNENLTFPGSEILRGNITIIGSNGPGATNPSTSFNPTTVTAGYPAGFVVRGSGNRIEGVNFSASNTSYVLFALEGTTNLGQQTTNNSFDHDSWDSGSVSVLVVSTNGAAVTASQFDNFDIEGGSQAIQIQGPGLLDNVRFSGGYAEATSNSGAYLITVSSADLITFQDMYLEQGGHSAHAVKIVNSTSTVWINDNYDGDCCATAPNVTIDTESYSNKFINAFINTTASLLDESHPNSGNDYTTGGASSTFGGLSSNADFSAVGHVYAATGTYSAAIGVNVEPTKPNTLEVQGVNNVNAFVAYDSNLAAEQLAFGNNTLAAFGPGEINGSPLHINPSSPGGPIYIAQGGGSVTLFSSMTVRSSAQIIGATDKTALFAYDSNLGAEQLSFENNQATSFVPGEINGNPLYLNYSSPGGPIYMNVGGGATTDFSSFTVLSSATFSYGISAGNIGIGVTPTLINELAIFGATNRIAGFAYDGGLGAEQLAFGNNGSLSAFEPGEINGSPLYIGYTSGNGSIYLGNTGSSLTTFSSAAFQNSSFNIGGSTLVTSGGQVIIGSTLPVGTNNNPLTIIGNSAQGEVCIATYTATAKGYGCTGIDPSNGAVITGSAQGDWSSYTGQSMNWSTNGGNTIHMKIDSSGNVKLGASATTQLYYCSGGTVIGGVIARGNSNATCGAEGGTWTALPIYVP